MWPFNRNQAQYVRRTKKQIHLDDLDDVIDDKQTEINDLNNQIIKLHKRKSDLADEVLNSLQEYQESGYEVPSLKGHTSNASNTTEVILEALSDPSLKIPKWGLAAFKSYVKKHPEANERIDGVIEKLFEQREKNKPSAEIIPR